MAYTPPIKPRKHANSPKIQHFGLFLTHLDRRFVLSGIDFRYIPGFPIWLHKWYSRTLYVS